MKTSKTVTIKELKDVISKLNRLLVKLSAINCEILQLIENSKIQRKTTSNKYVWNLYEGIIRRKRKKRKKTAIV